MGEFRIETERLILRGWRDEDVGPFMAGLNTAAVTRWLDGVKDRAFYEGVAMRARQEQADLGHCFWIIERKSDSDILGFCGIRRAGHPGTPVNGMAELGWRLREDAWGQGFAKEAAMACIDWGRANLLDEQLIAYTVPGNTASWGLMKRLGMVHRPELDFDHPAFSAGHELCRHITYSIARQ
jgi:RimJ/RimL family protein N-acetyltransferase